MSRSDHMVLRTIPNSLVYTSLVFEECLEIHNTNNVAKSNLFLDLNNSQNHSYYYNIIYISNYPLQLSLVFFPSESRCQPSKQECWKMKVVKKRTHDLEVENHNLGMTIKVTVMTMLIRMIDTIIVLMSIKMIGTD